MVECLQRSFHPARTHSSGPWLLCLTIAVGLSLRAHCTTSLSLSRIWLGCWIYWVRIRRWWNLWGLPLLLVLAPNTGCPRRTICVRGSVESILWILQVNAGSLRRDVGPRYLHVDRHIIRLEIICFHPHISLHVLASIDSQGRLQQKSDLIPVSPWTPRGCRQHHCGLGSFEESIEPSSNSVNQAWMRNLEIERQLYLM